MSIPVDYISHLKEFVNLEQDTQNYKQLEIWRKPISVRVGEAMAIDEVRIISYTENQALLSIKENLSKFREGDALRLNRGNPEENFFCCELIDELDNNQLLIKPSFNTFFRNLFPLEGWVLDFDTVDIRRIQLSVLEEVAIDPNLKNYFFQMFTGRIKPIISPLGREYAATHAQVLGLNSSQVEAFTNAYLTENFYLIQGPPGTGKTRVLAHLAQAFAEDGKRVLVTAFTHRAINNALRATAEKTSYPDLIKIGQQNNATDLKINGGEVKNFEYLTTSPYSPESKGVIIGATCFALRTRRLQEMQFDVAIFDEAGQVTLPLAIIGMLKASKSIFIGDHMQMAPVITAKHANDWVSKSIFETLFMYTPGTMLDITYRMNDEINRFPSRKFYGGRLRTHPKNSTNKLALASCPKEYVDILNPDNPDIFIRVNHRNRGLSSPEEALIIGKIIAQAVKCGVPPKEIAVVAPYRAQGRLIRQEIRKCFRGTNVDPKDIIVDTVERIQGQEREMIIVSLTTSDPAHAAQNAEFYFKPNRLNVAITRPKTKRIIIGSPNLFAAQPNEKVHQEWVKIFRELYEQCTIIEIKE